MTILPRLFALSLASAFACTVAHAGGAPAGALNKTITISFVSSGMLKSSTGQSRGFNTSVRRMIYVSSAGRLFMRHVATSGRLSRGGDFDPDDKRTGKGNFRFEGQKLVGVIPYAAGARQISATFDPGFSSCTASIIEGHAGGTMKRKGPSGEMFELSGVTTSSPSCSVQSGNSFAG